MGHFLSTLISIVCSCYFKWDNKTKRSEGSSLSGAEHRATTLYSVGP